MLIKKTFYKKPLAILTHFITAILFIGSLGTITFYWTYKYLKITKKLKTNTIKENGHLIVLGKKIKSNLDDCLLNRIGEFEKLVLSNKFHSIIFSGGGIEKSEASSMKEHSSYKESIILEEDSLNTFENLLYSKEKIPKNEHVFILSSIYHLRRIDLIAQNVFSSFYVLPAPTKKQPIKTHLIEILSSGWLEIYFTCKKIINKFK